MESIIENTIERIYKTKDYDFFRKGSKLHLAIPTEVSTFARDHNILMIKNVDEVSPACRWILQYNNYVKNDFSASYSSTILVNKLIPIFYLQHEFEVEHKDDERMTPVLDGFDVQPYTKTQAEMQEILTNCLIRDGYKQISYAELNECVHSLRFSNNVSIFGPNVTVEQCLFNDFMGICEGEF